MKPGYDYGYEFEYGLDPGRHRKGQGGRLTRTAPEVHFRQKFVPATLTSRCEAAP
jgi:hypothetical protein